MAIISLVFREPTKMGQKYKTAPRITINYNDHMGGIDKADMLRCFYDGNKKKWWHRHFFL